MPYVKGNDIPLVNVITMVHAAQIYNIIQQEDSEYTDTKLSSSLPTMISMRLKT